MPEVTYQGRVRKIACGPCIRGHRSSKCQHFDRIMYEVRRPGRPLSTCMHPPGRCPSTGCETDEVLYTVPAQDTDCGYTLMVGALVTLTRERRQANRRSASNVTNGSGSSGTRRQNASSSSSAQAASNSTSATHSVGSPATPVVDTNGSQPSEVASNSASPNVISAPEAEVKSEEASAAYTAPQTGHSIRLGMMGVGGYQASPDQMGWSGEWPEPSHNSPALSSRMQLNGTSDAPHTTLGNSMTPSTMTNGSPQSMSTNSPYIPMAIHANGVPSTNGNTFQQPPTPHQMAIGVQIPHGPILNGMDVHDFHHQHRLALFRGQRLSNAAAHGAGGPSQQSVPLEVPLQNLELVNDESEASRMMDQIDQGCDCGGQCECQACPIHADNSATRQYVMEEFAAHQQLPEIATPIEEGMSSYDLPMRSPLEAMPPQHSEDGNALWHTLNDEYRQHGYPVQNHHDFHMQQDGNLNGQAAPAPPLFNQPPASFTGCGLDMCKCGEGCLCMGCITHNGHNGETIAPLGL